MYVIIGLIIHPTKLSSRITTSNRGDRGTFYRRNTAYMYRETHCGRFKIFEYTMIIDPATRIRM